MLLIFATLFFILWFIGAVVAGLADLAIHLLLLVSLVLVCLWILQKIVDANRDNKL